MRMSATVMMALMGIGVWASPGTGEEHAAPIDATNRVGIQVIDLTIVTTNRVMVGTNTMSLAAATNLIAVHRESLDFVAVHGSVKGDSSLEKKSSAIDKLSRFGVPLLVVEKDGVYNVRGQSDTNGIRTISIGTDQIRRLRRLWRGKQDGSKDAPDTVVQTTVRWDTGSGTYELSGVELGMFGKKVWLIHEYRESDEESDTIGIRFKKEW